jgi:hypothetical protein
MPVGAVAFIGAFGAVVGLLIWRLSTMRTHPEGYTKIGSFDTIDIIGVRRILENEGLPFLHVLVPTTRAAEAIALLERERAVRVREAPPA